jgi:membrane protein DedA with SNARE-associated domain
MINQIVFWLTFLVEQLGYIGVSLSMFIESFFVPIPSELIMPFAGFLASQGKMSLILVILLGGISSYLGTLPFYFIGYFGNKIVIDKLLKKYGKYFFISEDDVDRSFDFFKQYGNLFVLFGRIVPIVRSVISLPAGVARMNFMQFSIYTLIGSTVWSAILAILGYTLGSNWSVIGSYVAQYEKIILIIIGALVVGFISLRLIKSKK